MEGKFLHVYGTEIVPSSVYEVQATADEIFYSDVLTIGTSLWGDICADITGTMPPDGSVSITTDVMNVLNKFKNYPAPSKVRCDLATSVTEPDPRILDQSVDISVDVLHCMNAFRRHPYPYDITQTC